MVKFRYFLAESAVSVSGRRVIISDPYDVVSAEHESIEDLEINLTHVAQSDRPIFVELNRGDRSFDVAFTPDGRVRSLEYNSTGAGTRVVSGIVSFVTFVGSLALSVTSPAAASATARARARKAINTEGSNPRAIWEAAHPDMVTRKKTYVSIAKKSATELAHVHNAMIEAESRALRELEIRARVLKGLFRDATDEVAKIETFYAEWRSAQRTTTESDIEVRIPVADLPRRIVKGFDAPSQPFEGQPGYELWRDFGLILEVFDQLQPNATEDTPTAGGPAFVWWRQPREVDLWVWKQDGDQAVPVSVSTIGISDHACSYGSMELTSRIFGKHGGSLTFNDDGSPSQISHNQESPWAAFADSLKSTPESVGSGIAQSKDVVEAVISVKDARFERERAKTARELEIAENQLKLGGVEATESDYADLQRAEQAVKLQTARRSLSPEAIVADDLQQRLTLITNQNKINSERRAEDIESSVADLKAQVALLELEVSKVEAIAKLSKLQ